MHRCVVYVAGDLVHVAGNFDRSFIVHEKPNTDVSGKISKQKVSYSNVITQRE